MSIVKHIALAFLLIMAWSGSAVADSTVVIYNNIPSPLPAHVPSQPFQAGHASEFGDLIQFAGTNRALTRVNVLMDDGAQASIWLGSCPLSSSCTATGWMHLIKLNLYNVDNSGPNPAPGTLIASRTQTFAIPWNPGPSGGLSFPITFDFTGVTVPDQIIYGVTYNTQTFGYFSIGVPGPYDSLNVGVNNSGGPAPYGPPSVGSRPFPDTAYLYAETPAYYSDGLPPAGVFRRDTNWTPYSAAVSFEAFVPTPIPALSPLALIVLALAFTLIAWRSLRA